MKTALHPRDEQRLDEGSDNLLTGRQRQILGLVSMGHTNREIAVILKISVRTVEVHRFSLMRRLNVRNVAQLLRRALHLGLLSSRDMGSHPGDRGTGVVVRFPDGKKPRKTQATPAADSMRKCKINLV